MRLIVRKSARAIWRNKKAYGACIAVLSIGMMIYISMFSLMSQLEYGIDRYYDETNFADVFASVAAMPTSELKRLESIEGIEQVQAVLTQDVKVVMEGSSFIVKIKLVGANTLTEESLNQYSYSGYPLENTKDIWLGEDFYAAYQLSLGDTISLRINGKQEDFTISGTISSPEYIYVVESGAVIANEMAYTIGFVQANSLAELLQQEGVVNELSFALSDAYCFEDVQEPLQQSLERYGVQSLVARSEQASTSRIKEEVNELSIIGTVLPIIFLCASIIMMYILLKRMVEQERGEIGTLKAFGFHSGEIFCGYLINGLLCGAIAFLIGLLLSFPFGIYMYDAYQTMFSLPDPSFQLSGSVALSGFLLSLAVSLVAVWFGSSAVLKIHPAEAMRAAAPAVKISSFTIKSAVLLHWLGQKGNMVLRSVSRNLLRAALTVLCIGFAFAMMNVIVAMRASVIYLIEGQTTISERYDIKATLQSPKELQALLREAEGMQGVSRAEGLLAMSITLVHENRQETVAIYGLAYDSELYRIRDTDGRFYAPSREGLMLSASLAEKLQLQAGDIIELHSSYLLTTVKLPVVLVFEEPMGPGCYMELEALSSLFGAQNMANSLLLSVQPSSVELVQSTLIDAEQVSSVANQAQVTESNESMMESLNTMIGVFVAMAFLMALGSVYSISRITLTEKQRELATMRVLGFSVDEVYAIHANEQWLLFFLAVCFGMLPSMLLKDFIAGLFNNDSYTMSIDLSVFSVAISALGCALAMELTNRIAKKEISGYLLAEVLKERE